MRFLLILFLIFLIVPYLLRLLFPWLLRYMGQRMEKRIRRSFGENNRTKAANAAGNTIKRPAPKRKKIDKNVGEYVEYEEIKE
ncbi:MAG: DUF4834 family protein [Prevotellaceae bacterium]|jgi:hypothetical protein|nr:DUF4834 family protein [Prevotellaceae bacterium]